MHSRQEGSTLSTSEGRSDLDAVETEDTIAIDVNEMTQTTATATVAQAAVPATTVSPLGNFDPNLPPPR
jgi:hypothetical protein